MKDPYLVIASGIAAIGAYKLAEHLLCPHSASAEHQSSAKSNGRCPVGSSKEKTEREPSKIYEEQKLVDQYMLFNYSSESEMILFDLGKYANITNCLDFPKKVALLCRDHCPDIFFSNDSATPRSALDVGCAVGRSCFELSKLFDSVVGIDYSANFIKCCERMATEKQVSYESTLEGNIMQKLVAKLDSDVRVDRIKFEVGDACNLRSDLGSFDLVLASNLICRLTEPLKFLNRLKTLVKKNGYAILSTPLTWGSEYTDEENWLGGYVDAEGKPVFGLDGLKASLNSDFELRKELHLPMVIRETQRKFQYTFCLVTVWQKK